MVEQGTERIRKGKKNMKRSSAALASSLLFLSDCSLPFSFWALLVMAFFFVTLFPFQKRKLAINPQNAQRTKEKEGKDHPPQTHGWLICLSSSPNVTWDLWWMGFSCSFGVRGWLVFVFLYFAFCKINNKNQRQGQEQPRQIPKEQKRN